MIHYLAFFFVFFASQPFALAGPFAPDQDKSPSPRLAPAPPKAAVPMLAPAPFKAQGPALPKPPVHPMGSSWAPAPTWAELTPQEREALAPLQSKFNSLDKHQRRKWKTLANRFPSWPPEKRRIIQSRMLAWASMTPEQRAAARQQAMATHRDRPSHAREESWKRWGALDESSKTDLHNKTLDAAGEP